MLGYGSVQVDVDGRGFQRTDLRGSEARTGSTREPNDGQRDIREELRALRGHSLAMQTDVHNIYNILNSLEGRVDRIERRLELRDDAAE